LGTNTYWSQQSTFAPATGFYAQNSTSFPLGAGLTGPIWLSDGRFYKSVVDGVVTASLPCPNIACPGRTNPVEFNLVNISGIQASMDATYLISYDGINYYYTGNAGASGPGFNNLTTEFYDPLSFIQAIVNVPTPGNLSVVYTIDNITVLQDFIPTPATFITPPYLALTGSNEWSFTWTP
jgi:hypothetical protein